MVALFTVGLVAGCGGGQQAAAPKAEEKVKIALILPSTIDDAAWAQSMYEGIKAVETKMGKDKLELRVSERLSKPVDAGAAIRQAASEGFSIVIAHGSQYQSVVQEVAKEFPKTTFAYGTGFQSGPNIFAYDPQAQEGAYLLGFLAGKLTKSNIVGIVGPVEAGDAIKYNKGFEQGVKAANPEAKLRIAYTGSFGDIVKAGELAKTHMDAGADVITGSSQQSVGGIKAVAAKPGAYWLSTDMDQSSLAPETVLAAQAYNWEKVVTKMIELRKAGTLGGQHLTISFAEGNLDLKINPKLADKIPADVKAAVDKAKDEIVKGALKIEVSSK
ncbi:BMP family ABC transporter substrate-binding protein [Heliobacterium undosum]|uniref:BMP family ABC transporter substrate-binding protein n=2 Tax=Heliomicrobium undosum TaxID=121734 RepID=A0A845L8G8_9FIRM|nr:BMP family ABC transporter substrate-binding protein [Heliomicrobium undosum]